ncbi:MAG: Wzz/FepE/Etk N-terminal domain-containing protein [Bacteroidales bacterium]
MTSENKNFELNSTTLLQTLWSYRKILISVGVFAIIASTIAAFLITPKFKATAIIYPPVANQTSKELVTQNKQEGLTVFGETEEAEQFLQILTSRTLKDSVIMRLNLMKHWDIKSTDKHAMFDVYSKFDQNIRTKPTQYQSVIIEVMDEKPEMAAKIANAVVDISDTLMRAAKSQIAKKALVALEQQYDEGLKEMKCAEDSLTKVMQNGVVHLKKQSEQFYKDYTKALLSNDKRAIDILEKQIKPLQQYGSMYERYRNEIQDMALQLTELRLSLKVLRVEAAQTIPSQFVIDRAVAPDKKAYPKRSIVIVVSTLASLFFAVFAVVFVEFVRQFIAQK